MYAELSLRKIFYLLADSLAVALSFYLLSLRFSYGFFNSWKFLLLQLLLTLMFTILSNDYSLAHRRRLKQEIVYTFTFAVKLSTVFIIIIFLSQYIGKTYVTQLSVSYLLIQFVVQFILIFSLRYLSRRASDNLTTKKKKILFVTNFTTDFQMLKLLEKNHYQVVAYLSQSVSELVKEPILRNFEEVQHLLQHNEIQEVFIDSDARQEFIEEQHFFNAMGIPVSLTLSEDNLSSVFIQQLGNMTFVTSALNNADYRLVLLKRMIDIIGALVGLVLTGLVAIVIYPIIQKQSKGPLIFKQQRVGENGKIFTLYKFRSMYLDAEERKKELMAQNNLETDLMFKMDHDPRIFPFGQKIRDWSLDELPQFLNVLKGDMSLVGTRPPTLEEYHKYELHHFKRLAAKPGITGMWQISGRSNITDFEDVVNLDLSYIKNWSVWLDIKILFKTVEVVLRREGSK